MTFYQELQLNQAGSKLMIQEAVGRRAKAWHLLVYLGKILLTMVFCVAFVTLYGWVFGAENNIVGVVVLLCLMVLPSTASADSGPKPAVTITVVNAPEGVYYLDLLHREAKVERVDYGESIEVEAICTPVQLGRLKDYIVSGWTPPKEFWED